MFEIGKLYNRLNDIHLKYGGQRQGGISTPTAYPMIFIFTGTSGEEFGYQDGFAPNGVFWYTGEGQKGDMQMIKGNLAIRNHIQNNKKIHLFEYENRGIVKYLGEASYLGYHIEQRPDINKEYRQAFIFELDVSVNPNEEKVIEKPFDIPTKKAFWNKSFSELKEIIHSKPSTTASSKTRYINVFERSEAVRIYVLKRANGVCECCSNPAPFISKINTAFLEVHHIKRLADGGPDDPKYVVAVCPNCHREAHYGKEQKKIYQKLEKYLNEVEL